MDLLGDDDTDDEEEDDDDSGGSDDDDSAAAAAARADGGVDVDAAWATIASNGCSLYDSKGTERLAVGLWGGAAWSAALDLSAVVNKGTFQVELPFERVRSARGALAAVRDSAGLAPTSDDGASPALHL